MNNPVSKRRLLLVATSIGAYLLIPVPATASPADRVGEKIEDVVLRDMKGREAKLLDYHKGKVLVIAYTGLGCPISNRYAPRLMKLAKEHRKQGVRFVGINANPQDSRKAISKEAKELGIKFPMLQDKAQKLTEQLDAKTTTEVFVVDKDGIIRYRGMIDDQYALGEGRTEPKYHYLDKGIRAALKGETAFTSRTAAPGCVITRVARKAKKDGKITYASHVARVVQDNCVKCHREGQIGPFPLTSYEKVAGWSAMIDFVVGMDRMPPWNAAEEFDGKFENERRLSEKDKGDLLAWIKDGMPRGDPKKEPKPKKWPKRWRIGKPDKVYNMPKSFLVPKDGVVDYQYFMVKTDYPKDMWIKAAEARPGAPDVVHHVLVAIADANGGFSSKTGLESGFLCATVPGDTPAIFPDGKAKKLPAGATLILQLHYTTVGKARRDRSSVGFVFADEPVEQEVLSRGIYDLRFEIPPGASNHEIRASHTFSDAIDVLSLYPHMHFRGKDWKFLAHLPDGSELPLLSVPRYDFNWQESYILKEPVHLPAGTRVECVAHYDNSDANFDNPDPTKPVRWGDQTWEEMMIGYVDYVPATDSGTQTASVGTEGLLRSAE